MQRRVEGPDIGGKTVLIVEDTSTTGGSPSTAVEAAREAGAHDPDTEASHGYGVAFMTCPATLALDRAQAAAESADEPLRQRGLHPDRARRWLTYTAAEGIPDFSTDD